MNKPLVSVIIPIYNTENYLEECLDSVINQTLKDIEIICVDDGSTDGSLKILKEYASKDDRIKVLHQGNKGAGAARNAGIEVAKGEYLSFLDGDDFFELCMLEEMYNCSKKNNTDITICSANRYDIHHRKYELMPWALKTAYLPATKPVFNYTDMPDYIFNFAQNWNWNKFYRKEFISKNKISFQPIYRTNDLLFTCLALVKAQKITTINKPLVNYRVGSTTNSQSTNHLHPLDFYKAFVRLRVSLVSAKIYNKVKQSYKNHALDGLTYNVLSITDKNIQKKTAAYLYSFGLKNIDLTDVYDVNIYDSQHLKEFERQKALYKNKFMLFDIDNSRTHKIITLLGIKIKRRNIKK